MLSTGIQGNDIMPLPAYVRSSYAISYSRSEVKKTDITSATNFSFRYEGAIRRKVAEENCWAIIQEAR